MNRKTNKLLVLAAPALAILLAGCSSPGDTAAKEGAAAEAAEPTKVTGNASQSRSAPARPQPRSVTLPEGTSLRVRTTTAISSNSHETGDSFTATLEAPVMDGDRVVLPKGTEVRGLVAEADKGGRVKGRAHLALRLTRLSLPNGDPLEITTNTITREARSTQRGDAAKIGVGTGIGAAVGAIAGGGQGAAIGAAAGAGAGTATVLATRGEAAAVPSETVLHFSLRVPVTVTEAP
jgi:hypothetical protein